MSCGVHACCLLVVGQYRIKIIRDSSDHEASYRFDGSCDVVSFLTDAENDQQHILLHRIKKSGLRLAFHLKQSIRSGLSLKAWYLKALLYIKNATFF